MRRKPLVLATMSQFFLIVCLTSLLAADTDRILVESASMNKVVPVIIVTPTEPDSAAPKFPVVYLLHGHGGDYRSWPNHVNLEQVADDHQFILVCPDASKNSWYLDSPVNPHSQYETFIAVELVQWIDDTYPTIASKRGRAITGLSMGGHGSLYLAIRHPDTYCAAGSMSGGVDLTYSTTKWEISDKLGPYEEFPERWHDNSIVNMIESLKGQDLGLLIDCGVDDFFIDINRNLHQRLLEHGIPHDYIERPGGHSWEYWTRVLEYHLLFFREAFGTKQK